MLFLMRRSMRNRVAARLRRLRRPRYLLFALVGFAYFYLFAVHHWIAGVNLSSPADVPDLPAPLVEALLSLVILGAAAAAWCGPTPAAPLHFSPAEIQYFFTAPLPRESLIRWKLMRGQAGVLFSAALLTLVAGPRVAPGRFTIALLGAWMALATVNLHLTGIRIARHRLARRGLGWAPRALITVSVVAAACAVSAIWIQSHAPLPEDIGERGLAAVASWTAAAIGTGPLGAIAWPARLVVRPALASGAIAFLLAALPALAILLLNYVWILRVRFDVREGALEAAALPDRRLAPRPHGSATRARIAPSRPPFRLAPTGRPEAALAWKSLVAISRRFGGAQLRLAGVAGLVAAAGVLAALRGRPVPAVMVSVSCGAMTLLLLLIGPRLLGGDFGEEMRHIDGLRSYPLAGRSLVAGTLMTPSLILTAAQCLLFGVAIAVAAGGAAPLLGSAALGAGAGMAFAILALPMNLVSALLHNAVLLLAPGWVLPGSARVGGVEAFGQRMVAMVARLLALALCFLPGAALFGLAWALAATVVGPIAALPLAALPTSAVLAAEAWLGIVLLGAWLDRFDPSKELDSAGIE